MINQIANQGTFLVVVVQFETGKDKPTGSKHLPSGVGKPVVTEANATIVADLMVGSSETVI